MSEPERGVTAVPFPQHRFDLSEEAQRQDAAEPASVEGQDAFGPAVRIEMLVAATNFVRHDGSSPVPDRASQFKLPLRL